MHRPARSAGAPAGHISREPAAFGPEIHVATAKDAERSAPSDFLRQQVFLVTPCANRSRRHYGHPPVVTTRKLPQPTRVWRALALVVAPSDGLTARQFRRPCNAICSARSSRATSAEAPSGAPRARGQWRISMDELPTGKRHRRQTACRAGQWKTSAQNGSGVPGPLKFPQRSGVRDGQKH